MIFRIGYGHTSEQTVEGLLTQRIKLQLRAIEPREWFRNTYLPIHEKLILEPYPDVTELRKELKFVQDEILNIFIVIRRVVGIVDSVMLGNILIIVSAPPLLRIATAWSVALVCKIFS